MPLFHNHHVRAFCHATEDPEKVRAAVRNASHDAKLAVEETVVEGSHGNRIGILEGSAKGSAERALFDELARDDPRGYATLTRDAEKRLDENLNFHVRLDKQEAYLGRTVLARDDDAITVRAKVRSFPVPGSDPHARALQELRTFLEKHGRSAGLMGQ
jgi:RNA-binding protein